MEDMKKDMVNMADNESKEPVSWATLFCRLFACMAEEMIEQLGEEKGEKAVRDAVWKFGVARGKDIARRAKEAGCENDIDSYLPNYDMGRADDFSAQNEYGDNEVKQLFTECGFAEAWLGDGTERYGKLYCDMIDPAIVHGYNENMECIHDKRIYEDGVCSFCFKMKDK